MRISMFYHSLISDWNHGNAHFLRGIVAELIARGHRVRVYEPTDSWSVNELLADQGDRALGRFAQAFPNLQSIRYNPQALNIREALRHEDLVIVHEWNDPELVQMIGQDRQRRHAYRLLFHDTHHRCVSQPRQMAQYDLRHYDGVLAFGQVLRDLYLRNNWARRAWTWHEAADVRVFDQWIGCRKQGDLVWIGNWGDEERNEELHEFLLEPVRNLGIRARAYGVRYPERAQSALLRAGIEYGGWLPNFEVPEVLGHFRVTVHIPRRPYAEALPGIPTIRPFEAMACGIPLVSAPWRDCEQLFTAGEDYLLARDGIEMQQHLRTLLENPALAASMAAHARQSIRARHTCAHRVDELLNILEELNSLPQVVNAPGSSGHDKDLLTV